MGVVTTILSSFAIAAGVIGSLMILTMCLAGGANSTPEQIRQLKMYMLITAAGGFICLGAGIWLLAKHHPGWGAAIGGLPMIVVIVGIIWLTISTLK